MKKYRFSYTFQGRLKTKNLYAETKTSAKNKFYRNMKEHLAEVEVISIDEMSEIIYGIWNSMKKEFQFGISEKTPNSARKKLFKKIGYDSLKWRFEIRPIKEIKINETQTNQSN